ncbi:MAG TPA: hypothetical protein VFY42_10145 [Gemmatimonadales bacterium]|nr:hypothetical protein [Gemmatimonadales bacterium]
MKKTYAAPALLISGDAVRETLQSSIKGQPEMVAPLIYRPFSAGAVGFAL